MSESVGVRDVIVAGGGLAGVACSVVFARMGFSVTLLERAQDFGEVGAGIQLAPNATRLLRHWGVLDTVLETSVQPKRMVIRDGLSGEELASQDLFGHYRDYHGAPYIVAHRADAHRVLVRECERLGVEMLTGVEVTGTTTVGKRVNTHTSAGVFDAAVCIGADGVKSVLRSQIVTDKPIFSGFVAYRGTVETSEVGRPIVDEVEVHVGPDNHMVQYPLRGGALLNTVAVIKTQPGNDGSASEPSREELVASYPGAVDRVLESLDFLGHGFRWPMFDRDPIAHWRDGRMVLIGDAAHPMLQYLAQGAAQALEDAGAFGRIVEELGGKAVDWDKAIDRYVAERAPRTARVQTSARLWGESWHVQGTGRKLRNMLYQTRYQNDFTYSDWLWRHNVLESSTIVAGS